MRGGGACDPLEPSKAQTPPVSALRSPCPSPTGGVPVIEYHINEKRHVYFPDIYIPDENKIIEVKSEWSLQYPTHVEEKAQATVSEGYIYEIWVYNGNKKMTRKIAYTFDGEKVSFPA